MNRRPPLNLEQAVRQALAQKFGTSHGQAATAHLGEYGVDSDTARHRSLPGLQGQTRVDEEPHVKLLPGKGTASLISGRHKEKKERISETLDDLHLAIQGLSTQESRQDPQGPAKVLSSLARLCSVFLRKLVLGDRGDRTTRLLDDDVLGSMRISLQPVRKIPRGRRKVLRTGFGVDGGSITFTKIDEPGPVLPRYQFALSSQNVEFAIHWPLPGAADWTGRPTEKNPWLLSAQQLFNTGSNRRLSCDNWLGQQVVIFDGIPISLRDIVHNVATLEGAHAINVPPPREEVVAKPRKRAHESALQLLSSIMLFGIPYSHVIVIETAFYLYENLLAEPSIRHPNCEYNLRKPAFWCPLDQASSLCPEWLQFSGTMKMTFGDKKQSIRHTIKPVR